MLAHEGFVLDVMVNKPQPDDLLPLVILLSFRERGNDAQIHVMMMNPYEALAGIPETKGPIVSREVDVTFEANVFREPAEAVPLFNLAVEHLCKVPEPYLEAVKVHQAPFLLVLGPAWDLESGSIGADGENLVI
jgi:hypothetical protein